MAHIVTVLGKTPKIHPSAFVAPNATLIGDVVVEAGANIWFGVVLRADQNRIRIGERSSIQDNTVVHCNEPNGTIIGREVTIGHAVVMEGCEIRDRALIGMNATILDGALVGEDALVAAGSVVKENGRVDPGTFVAGVPARLRGELSEKARAEAASATGHYQRLMALYAESGEDHG
ncbi:MAG: gamma carbonic anhydrase family protein [Gemmatimonadota bacterium]|jgi:carbonic anhydrase/acetyltransferase-like protein (isoleucine patch superfamily)|nr:gamma carbonic anhydrase family protein [Gemmatimonadota bacterium]MDP6529826.1 gamma carbonic anhydrase family protein [Gemmatimonadota bacterium]MDP6802769.1 gamma carbonic anhydrase family protein [Gemmatimonadota bacterium]MDP7032107.1 gamma carbonic anhydrase family protein [Gemmatimonadota bacterium]